MAGLSVNWNRDSSQDILPPTPLPSQNLYAWAGDGSGENYARSAADDIIVTPDLPEHLYGWTDYHRTGTQLYKWVEPGTTLYAWYDSTNNGTFYTDTPNPIVGDPLYDTNGTLITGGECAYIDSVSEGSIVVKEPI